MSAQSRSRWSAGAHGLALLAERVGGSTIAGAAWTLELIGAIVETLVDSMRPSSWTRTARAELLRQIFFTAVQPLPFITLIALLTGVVLALQGLLWLNVVGQRAFIGQLLVLSLFREMGPLLVGMIVIGRSGLAITGELATMKADGQVLALESQGVDVARSVMLPRCIGLMISSVCLCIWLIAVAVVGGYVAARATGASELPFSAFALRVMEEVGPADAALVLLKGTLPGLATGLICCSVGLSVGASSTEPARALPSAFVRSLVALFVISVTLSVVM